MSTAVTAPLLEGAWCGVHLLALYTWDAEGPASECISFDALFVCSLVPRPSLGWVG